MNAIQPTAIYDSVTAMNELGIQPGVLARARRERRVRYTRQGPKFVYLGQWLLDWLESEAAPAGKCK